MSSEEDIRVDRGGDTCRQSRRYMLTEEEIRVVRGGDTC